MMRYRTGMNALFFLSIGLLGAAAGFFLDRLCLRIPQRMQREWTRDAREYLALPARPDAPYPAIGWPSRSTAVVALAGATLADLCAWRFGFTVQLAAALSFSALLLMLALIDLRTMLLPDSLTLPLLWLGLLLSLAPVFAEPRAAIIGAAGGYLGPWALGYVFQHATGKQGLGHGDFKLLAALSAWFGWMAAPLILLIASVSCAIVSIASWARRGDIVPLPFGPHLALAAWLVLFFNEPLQHLLYRI